MSKAEMARDPLRYRLYYWLMNASFVAMFVAVTIRLAGLFIELELEQVPAPILVLIQGVVGPVLGVLSLILPIFLIAVSWWRDEYAEMLWQRTVRQVVLFFTVVPPLLLMFLWIAYLVVGGEERPDWLGWLYDDKRPLTILSYSWDTFILTFLCLFQFNRWKDAR